MYKSKGVPHVSTVSRTTTEQLWDMLRAEQAEFVDMAQGLSPTQWAAPSLCEGWQVRDVVLHAAAHIHGKQRDKEVLAQFRDRSTDELIQWLASPAKEFRAPFASLRAFDVQVQLGELLVHQQDVRRPLGLARAIPQDRLATVLDFGLKRLASPALASSRKRAKGLRLVATDIDWSFGHGSEIHGPAEAILMATSGRGAAAGELSGAGTEALLLRVPR